VDEVGARGPTGASLLLLLAKLCGGGDEEEEEEEVLFRPRCPRSLAGFRGLRVWLSVMEVGGSDSWGAASGRCCWVTMGVSVRGVGSCSGWAQEALEVD